MILKTIFSLAIIIVFNLHTQAQILTTNLGVGVDAIVEHNTFPSITLGIEGGNSRHWTVSGAFIYGSLRNEAMNGYAVDKSHYAFDVNANFYFREMLQGFKLSAGGFYGRNLVDPAAGEENIPPAWRSDNFAGLQLGLGFSQRLTDTWSLGVDARLGQEFYRADARLWLGLNLGYNFLASTDR